VKYAPKKVFIIENGKYIELTYEEYILRKENNDTVKFFLPLYGVLMEVSEDTYKEYYKDRRRQKYLAECSKENGEISYDSLTTDEFNGEDILVDKIDVLEEVERKLMRDLIHKSLLLLPEEERKLMSEIYVEGLTERQLAKKYGISQVAIHKRKNKILTKLKKILEN